MIKVFFSRDRGFTLIELIILIVIIGILVSLTTGSIQGAISRHRLNVSAGQLVSYLRKTRQLAITNYTDYGLELISNTEYGIYKVGETGYIERIKLDNGITATHSRANNKTTFSPLGMAYSSTITLTNSRGDSLQVIIGSSGRIRLNK